MQFGIVACACLDTSGVASLRQTSTRLNRNRTAIKKQKANADEWGWRADPLAPNTHITSCVFCLFLTTFKPRSLLLFALKFSVLQQSNSF